MSPPRRSDSVHQVRDDVSDVDSDQGQPVPLVTLSLAKADDNRNRTTNSEHVIQNTPKPRSSTSLIQRVRRWGWLQELFCCVLILAALITLIEVLRKAQGKPLQSWRHAHYDISINAVVAIISTVLKGASIFIVAEVIGQSKWDWFENPRGLYYFERIDSASRGPWGSARLIFGLRGPTIAFFGAAITIGALAVDPFTQNIVTSYACQAAATEPGLNPIVPTADGYMLDMAGNPPRRNSSGDFLLWGTYYYNLDAASKAAVYSGLYGSATSVVNGSNIQLGCPGVNCTFPKYSTLAICHRCADISSLVERTCHSSPPDDPADVFIPACNWTLPAGQSLSTVALGWDYFYKNSSIRDISNTFAVANSTLSTLTLGNTPGTFTNLTILANSSLNPLCTTPSNNDCSDWMGGPTFNFSTFAAECALFPCTRTYTATTVNGTARETEVGRTISNDTKWLQPWWNAPNGTPFGVTIVPENENCTQRVGTGACDYYVDGRWLVAAADFFWRFWDAKVTGYSWNQAMSSNDPLDILYADGIVNLTQVDRTMAAISDSMTAAIRLKGFTNDWDSGVGGGQGLVNGTAYIADTCILVRWGWIALPVAIGGLSILLFVLALLCGMAGNRRPPWKSSALPVLFHGIRSDDADSEGDCLSMADMEKKAKTLRVRMDRDENGYMHLVSGTRGV